MLIFEDITQVAKRDGKTDGGYIRVFIDEDEGGDEFEKDTRLMNAKREGNYKASDLTGIVTDSEEEFFIPKSIEDKYISEGILTDRPESSWKTKFW